MATLAKRTFTVPSRSEVSENNQAIFDNLNNALGFVPNLYAYYAKNDTALADYLALQNRKTSLNGKQKEVVNLITSQINECQYCLAAHTALGKINGFTDEEIISIRKNEISFDDKLAALAEITRELVINRGKVSNQVKEQFFAHGYTEANLIDTIVLVGDKTISNYIHNTTEIPIDFPVAPAI